MFYRIYVRNKMKQISELETITLTNHAIESGLIGEHLHSFPRPGIGDSLMCCNATGDVIHTHGANQSADVVEMPFYLLFYVSVLNGAIFLVGVAGNVMVIQVITRMKAMRSRMYYFLMSLSVADLLVLAICQPSAMLEFFGQDRWLLGEAMCKLVPFLEHASLHSSVLTLLVIGMERYYAICRPLSDKRKCLMSNTAICVACVWLSAFILSLPFIFMTSVEDASFFDGSQVKVCRTKMKTTLPKLYVVLMFCLFFILPMCMLTFMYASIIKKLFRLNHESSPGETTNVKAIHSRKQVVRMMVSIVILFFVSLLPIRIVGLWLVFTPAKAIESMGMEFYFNILSMSRILAYINSAGNPIIYGLISTKFRSAFSRSLPSCKTQMERRGSFTPRTGSPPRFPPEVQNQIQLCNLRR